MSNENQRSTSASVKKMIQIYRECFEIRISHTYYMSTCGKSDEFVSDCLFPFEAKIFYFVTRVLQQFNTLKFHPNCELLHLVIQEGILIIAAIDIFLARFIRMMLFTVQYLATLYVKFI
jgi:hypothetical protein